MKKSIEQTLRLRKVTVAKFGTMLQIKGGTDNNTERGDDESPYSNDPTSNIEKTCPPDYTKAPENKPPRCITSKEVKL